MYYHYSAIYGPTTSSPLSRLGTREALQPNCTLSVILRPEKENPRIADGFPVDSRCVISALVRQDPHCESNWMSYFADGSFNGVERKKKNETKPPSRICRGFCRPRGTFMASGPNIQRAGESRNCMKTRAVGRWISILIPGKFERLR